MIPKKIHYCWLSNDPYPESIQNCINSWKEILPDYEIVKWDTSRFDVNSVPYVKGAYDAKKYAFCADYIRIYALYHEGGIYLDSDVMVYKSFDPFLNHISFSSVEYHPYFTYAHIWNKKEKLVGIEAAVLGSEPGCQWLGDILEYYQDREFSMRSEYIMPRVIARILHQKYGFEYYPRFQKLDNDFYIYPSEVFSCKLNVDLPIKFATHLGANSWGNDLHKYRDKFRILLKKTHLLKLTRQIRGLQYE